MQIGYARVSTLGQELDSQLHALHRAGVRKVFEEKVAGAGVHREQLEQMLATLRKGDVVVVHRLDRLARSLRELMRTFDRIEAAGATLRSLTEPFDTSKPAGRLALQMLGAVGEFERAILRDRALIGLRAARASGVKLGRPARFTPKQTRIVAQQWLTGAYSRCGLAKLHGVSVKTLKRALAAEGIDYSLTPADAARVLEAERAEREAAKAARDAKVAA